MNSDVPDIQRLSRTEIEQYQFQRLRDMLAEILPRNRFWGARLAASAIDRDALRSPADLLRLPLTTKADLLADQQANPPYGTNLTYDRAAYSRMHQTSGTTGTPLRWLDTPASWNGLLQSWQQLFRLMGLRKDDRLLFAFSFGPFLGFWAGFEGANCLGNLCLAGGGLSSAARLTLLLENQATIVCCTPTYALRLAEVASEQQIDLRNSPVRAILVAGEPGGNIPATRERIEKLWGARVVDHWGMTELGPLAIATESQPGGLTMLETECIVEIIDPATGRPVPAGEEGELVVTNLGRWGSPLIRYRTGDRVRGQSSPQAPLLFLPGGILGRTDEMLTIRGNNLYPSALEDVIRGSPNVAEFRIELRTVKAMQHVKIEIEPVPGTSRADALQVASGIAESIKSRWHFSAEVVPVESGALPRFETKAKRFHRVD
ncbi:MAG: phenylacetate--CoA ligase family protein [Planctomycetaceae bacterium]|nr:phenylacetate--CoA ligase family protein [Planctomycetaceae bacterium]